MAELVVMQLFLMVQVVIAVSASTWLASATRIPLDSCNRTCGDIAVPYPFGMEGDVSEDCYISRGFQLTCNHTFKPAKLFLGDIEVTSINIFSSVITTLFKLSYACYGSSSYISGTWVVSLPNPYTLSYTDNVFTAVGCDTLARFRIGDNNFAGCMSGCSTINSIHDSNCSGIGCCQASIPPGVKWMDTAFYLRDNASDVYLFNPCSYSFVVQKDNYTFSLSDLKSMDTNKAFPVVVDFTIRNQTCEAAKADSSTYACASPQSVCVDSPSGNGYFCSCSAGYKGNPYLPDGCEDIDECRLSREVYPCYGNCVNVPGDYNCTCPEGSLSSDPRKIRCIWPTGKRKLSVVATLILGMGTGMTFLLLAEGLCCLEIQRRRIKGIRRKYFENHGGSLLQNLLLNEKSTFKIYSMAEIRKATNDFHNDQILGTGGFGTVYKGMLPDRTQIAVKRCMVVNERNGRDFANELFILSKVNHKNIVDLLGCCLEDEVPMLVYKFIPRGTLHHYIHARDPQPIPFSTRLRIATETAEALKYLHTDTSTPVLHGDIKTLNVLLDDGYVVKISDFGTSKLVPKEKRQLTTLVQGTFGYLDPEYMESGHLTAQSDVYSFGVVLLELMTRKMPIISEAGLEEDRRLASIFMTCMNTKRTQEILDPQIIQENGLSHEVLKVLDLAMLCLSPKGKERPTMSEVLSELQGIKVPESHPWEPLAIHNGATLHDGDKSIKRLDRGRCDAMYLFDNEC